MEFVKIFKNIVKTGDRNKIIKSIYILLDKLDISEEQKDVYKNAIEILDDTKLIKLRDNLINNLDNIEYRRNKLKTKNLENSISNKDQSLNGIRRKEILEKEKEELELGLLTSNL